MALRINGLRIFDHGAERAYRIVELCLREGVDGGFFDFKTGAGRKTTGPLRGCVVVGGAGIGYAVHEHHDAQDLAVQNAQVTAQLIETQSQMNTLAAKVNELAADSEAKATPSAQARTRCRGHGQTPVQQRVLPGHIGRAPRTPEFKKLQSQVDAQDKRLEDTRNDLVSASTELTGSIARTHDELVVLQKRGERNYYEFDVQKSKDFKREGPVSVCLRKANTKQQYADLQLLVDDRKLSQKHINLYQPVMYYQPDSQQPVEVIINEISKDHIHGYVSAPKYRPSELTASAESGASSVQGLDQANSLTEPPSRKKLPVPSSDSNNP